MVESILVFPRAILDKVGSFQGLSLDYSKYFDAILSSGTCGFCPRSEAESNFALKQIIPYVLCVHKGEVLTYIRSKTSGESRLMHKASIGIGGHINPLDGTVATRRDLERTVEAALERELSEEVVIKTATKRKMIAVLNDDADEVGRVHFGVIYLVELDKPLVEVNKAHREEIARLFFAKPNSLLNDTSLNLEGWSLVCLREIDALLKTD